jgi:serine phosphatase RsbU (regulator of sigma subunit)
MTQFDDEISATSISFGKASEATADMGHYLVAIDGDEPGKIVEVGTEPVTIGRDPKNVLAWPDRELSRLHARVWLSKMRLTAEDLGSTNGTFVNGARISVPTSLREGGILRLGRQVLKYERRTRRDVERSEELRKDLLKASSYVLSLLPAPVDAGAVRTDWRFHPSAQLGGDAFGYHWLDDDTFALYLLDVSGHGVGAAMHSVTVLNVLRQRALPNVDFASPGAVLSSLNDRFQMENHDGMYFTIWYGVYTVSTRTLAYSAAGHHPAYVVAADKADVTPLGVPEVMIGAVPDVRYEVQAVTVPSNSTVYVFSDGVFEIVTKEQRQWTIADFVPCLLAPAVSGLAETERLFGAVRDQAREGFLDDDFSLLAVTFL